MDFTRFAPEPVATEVPRPERAPRWWWRRLQLSPNTHRSFAQRLPLLRGWSHLAMAAVVWPLMALRLVWIAPGGTARAGAVAFALSMQLMFTVSAATHYRRWPVWTTELLFRLDHVGIFLAIAGSVTPLALLALDGWPRVLLLASAWIAGVLGIGVVLHPRSTPVGFANSAFIGAGALVLPFLPVLAGRVGVTGMVLLLGGAATYVVGAIAVALQRPRLVPHLFGYHEVWHALVVLGVVQHYAMVELALFPLA